MTKRARTTPVIDEVLDLARRFGPIWPQTRQKTGFRGTHGARDATTDPPTLREMASAYPDALWSLLTGAPSGIVALDIDCKNGRHGLDALEELGIYFNPQTPTAHTPSGGLHWFFRWPGNFVRSTCDLIGLGIELKADRAWITLPLGAGRAWDPHLGPDTPLAPMPQWALPPDDKAAVRATAKQARPHGLSPYGEAAFDSAVMAIMRAPSGAQEQTLNAEAFALGQLVAGGELPQQLALDALLEVARRMPSFDSSRPWTMKQLTTKVRRALAQGMDQPRSAR